MSSAAQEEQQPQLKYQRLGEDVNGICSSEGASCLCVTSKVLALGTCAGRLHILDVSGDEVRATDGHEHALEPVELRRSTGAGQVPQPSHRQDHRHLL